MPQMRTVPINLFMCLNCGTVQGTEVSVDPPVHAASCKVCREIKMFAPVFIDFERKQFLTMVQR